MTKNLVLGLPLAHLAQIRAANFIFFLQTSSCQSLGVMVSYHHVQYQKKTNDPILSKLSSDGQTDGQTDRLTRKTS